MRIYLTTFHHMHGVAINQCYCGASVGNIISTNSAFADDAVIFAEALEVLSRYFTMKCYWDSRLSAPRKRHGCLEISSPPEVIQSVHVCGENIEILENLESFT